MKLLYRYIYTADNIFEVKQNFEVKQIIDLVFVDE